MKRPKFSAGFVIVSGVKIGVSNTKDTSRICILLKSLDTGFVKLVFFVVAL